MDYEKKYKEAIERAKAIYYQGSYKPDIAATIAKTLQNIFPELAESEDERIRKELIDFLEYYRLNNVLDSKTISLLTGSVAWLEKQGEQKNPWSKEDEMMLHFAIAHFECQKRNCIEGGSRREVMQEYIDWLKSLRFKIQDVMSEDEFRHIIGYLVQDIVANEHMAETEKQPTKFFVEKYYKKLREEKL